VPVGEMETIRWYWYSGSAGSGSLSSVSSTDAGISSGASAVSAAADSVVVVGACVAAGASLDGVASVAGAAVGPLAVSSLLQADASRSSAVKAHSSRDDSGARSVAMRFMVFSLLLEFRAEQREHPPHEPLLTSRNRFA